MLNQPEMPPSRVLLATLINELNVITEDFILVLDDYHLIQQPAIHDLMAELLTHIPATCHIVLASRTDPRLPIPKFRAQNLVTEIRAGDLRFSKAEADSFLRQSLKRPIARQDAFRHLPTVRRMGDRVASGSLVDAPFREAAN